MDFDLSKLPTTSHERRTAIDLALHLANTDAGLALARTLANSTAGRALARALANSDAGRALARELANNRAGLALARDLANSDAGMALAQALANSAAGAELAQDLANSDAGRTLVQDLTNSTAGAKLAQDLANSTAGAELAQDLANSIAGANLTQVLASSVAGRDLAQTLANSTAGADLARYLASSDAGRTLTRYLASSVAGANLTQVLASSVPGRVLALDLVNSVPGRVLARALVDSVPGRDLARELAASGAGLALARALANSDAGAELARDLASSGAGVAFARYLASSVVGMALARDLASSDAGRTLSRYLANSAAETVAAVVVLLVGLSVLGVLPLLTAIAGPTAAVVFVAGVTTRTETDVDEPVSDPAAIEAGLMVVDRLDPVEGAEFAAQIEPDLAAIEHALLDGRYSEDPTVEDRIRQRLTIITKELRSPTPDSGVDAAFIRSAVASLSRELAPFHLDEPDGPAAQTLVKAVGDDPGDQGVPTRVLEQFEREGEGPFAVQGLSPTSPPSDEPNQELDSILAAAADPTLPGPVIAARGFGWLPPAQEAADAFTIAAGIRSVIATTTAAGVAAAATGAGPGGLIWAAGSTAIIHLLLVTLAYTWVCRTLD